MFSVAEKQKIAEAVEKVLLEIDHPEMPKEKPIFELHVDGKESWSFADIKPNWWYKEQGGPKNPNPWNEVAREVMSDET
jgi:hypothetical protein